MTGKTVQLTVDEAITVLKPLEEVVVSLDRIGARLADGDDVRDALLDYFTVAGATRRLAQARLTLSVALDRELPEEPVDHLLGEVPYWRGPS